MQNKHYDSRYFSLSCQQKTQIIIQNVRVMYVAGTFDTTLLEVDTEMFIQRFSNAQTF